MAKKTAKAIISDRNTEQTIQQRAAMVLEEAKKLLSDGFSKSEVLRKLNDRDGIVPRLFPSDEEKAEFTATRAAEELEKLLADESPTSPSIGVKPADAALTAPSQESSASNLSLEVPASLLKALEREAKSEGVSVNKLCIAKLMIPLDRVFGN